MVIEMLLKVLRCFKEVLRCVEIRQCRGGGSTPTCAHFPLSSHGRTSAALSPPALEHRYLCVACEGVAKDADVQLAGGVGREDTPG